MVEVPSGRFRLCILDVNDEPKEEWTTGEKQFWPFPLIWPSTSGEVSTLRSPGGMLNRLWPLRGVGEPSEVMLKAMFSGSEVQVDERDPRDAGSSTRLGRCEDNMQDTAAR